MSRGLRIVLALAPLALAAALYAPTLATGFLADDYTYLVSLGWWRDDGALLSRALRGFGTDIGGGSNYYRPLPIASFALNFAVAGAEPAAWRAVNLALHLACGALVAIVAAGLAPTRGLRAAVGAAVAAAIFVLSPAGPEVAAWVSGRFDALALVFMLAGLACFTKAARWSDGYGLAALAAMALALASKEAATLVPVLMVAVAIARPAADRDAGPGAGAAGTGALAVVAAALRRTVPWFVLLALYFGWRIALFGSPFRVYAGAEPVAALVSGDWLATLGTAAQWLAATMPDALARPLFALALVVSLALGGAWCVSRRETRGAWLALAAAVIGCVVAPVLQVRTLDPLGEGGRLFYVAAAALGLLAAFPFAATTPDRPWLWHPALRGAFGIATLVAIAAEAVLLAAALEPWRTAGTQSKALAAALARLPARIAADGYGFVLVPDRIGGVPFGRLAQGGLTLPPVQPQPLLPRLVVQTERDLAPWPDHLKRGLVDALKRYPARDVWPAVAAGRSRPGDAPTDFFCWDATRGELVALAIAAPFDDAHWLPAWRRSLAASACRDLAPLVPER